MGKRILLETFLIHLYIKYFIFIESKFPEYIKLTMTYLSNQKCWNIKTRGFHSCWLSNIITFLKVTYTWFTKENLELATIFSNCLNHFLHHWCLQQGNYNSSVPCSHCGQTHNSSHRLCRSTSSGCRDSSQRVCSCILLSWEAVVVQFPRNTHNITKKYNISPDPSRLESTSLLELSSPIHLDPT